MASLVNSAREFGHAHLPARSAQSFVDDAQYDTMKNCASHYYVSAVSV